MKKNAFTLIEILLALAILGIGLVSILSLFAVGVSSAKNAIDITRAGLAAQMTIETIKQQGYKNLTDGQQTLGDLTDSQGNNIYSEFKRQITVSQNPDGINYIPNLRKIELVISRQANNKEIARFITYLTKYEP